MISPYFTVVPQQVWINEHECIEIILLVFFKRDSFNIGMH